MVSGYQVTFETDPARFLERAGAHLADEPVISTVVATVAERFARSQRAATPYSWFAVVTGPAGEIVGAAMRTAPFPPYPLYVLGMPDAAAIALADALVDRAEDVGGANGSLPATRVLADRVAERTGGTVEINMHMRLFELGELVEARPVPGRLRPAYDDEADLVFDWFRRFHVDADEQAGHVGHGHRDEGFTVDDARDRITGGCVWLWVADDDTPLHMTCANPPAFGVARIGPVYTPKEHRGHGYASAAVGAVSRALRDGGSRVSLFTDQANPTSNGIYLALGYEPVVDTVDLAIR
ncbi:GNAT family N-acetyltransferase [Nocardioides humilatus]|uniref:GNAT family N-acetyltransferase n=2 Tax=Nocardioides humilatus TaxID=2607660 RepID=A0A5B1LFX5_9ACTN|nr:GNAT family N-acetyltransferase [Nocardioides humilatus]